MNQVASPLENPNRSTGELHLAVSIHKELSAFVQNGMGNSFAQTSNAVRLIPSHARLYLFRFARASTLAVLLTLAYRLTYTGD